MTIESISKLHEKLNNALFRIDSKLSYLEIVQTFIDLCDLINETDIDESLWWINDHLETSLDELITGAYWHFEQYHEGQESLTYAALSSLGSIYTPNFETNDNSPVFRRLAEMARGNV